MRIATWNVNSVRARCERILDFLDRQQIDVLAMQEIKCRPDQFPINAFAERGWEVVAHGLNQWNGVAVAVRASAMKIEETEMDFPNQPAYGNPGKPAVVEARALRAKICPAEGSQDFTPFEVYSLYVPNGRELTHPHYDYKLQWLQALSDLMSKRLKEDTDTQIALVGDWNVAPLDTDVWDMEVFTGCTHVSEPERAAFNRFAEIGFSEVTRKFYADYTYYDYKQLRFPRNQGMKIDFAYCSPAFAARVTNAFADREERRGKGASDHLPVILELD